MVKTVCIDGPMYDEEFQSKQSYFYAALPVEFDVAGPISEPRFPDPPKEVVYSLHVIRFENFSLSGPIAELIRQKAHTDFEHKRWIVWSTGEFKQTRGK